MSSRLAHFILLFLFGILESIRVTVTPALSQKLTSLGFLDFSLSQYGLLYLPFSLAAILAALWSGITIPKHGLNRIFNLAIGFDLLSMYLMGMTFLVADYQYLAFPCILAALFASGVGFGLILPAINTVLSSLFPNKTEIFITFFYLSLSIGSFILFFSLNSVMEHPELNVTLFFLLFILLYFAINFAGVFPKTFEKKEETSLKFLWPSCLAILCTGILESLFFNWTLIYLAELKGFGSSASHDLYLSYLTFFTLSQLVFGFILFRFSFKILYIGVPFFLSLVLLLTNFFFTENTALILFSLIGFFLACNMPFLLGFAKKIGGNQPRIFGFLIAFYTCGYGIGSYGFEKWQQGFYKFVPIQFFHLAIVFSCAVLFFNSITLMLSRKTTAQ